MAPNKFNYFLAAAVAALLLSGMAEARFRGVSPFCRTANYRMLCTEMVKDAGNLHDASVNAMTATMELAKRLLAKTTPAAPGEEESREQAAMKMCREDLEGTVSDVEVSLGALDANDVGSIASHLSASLQNDCKDAMKEAGVSFPFGRYMGLLRRHVDNCMAVVLQN